MSNYSVENIPRGVLRKLVHRILSNYHIDLSDFLSAALSSVALHMKKSSCVNVVDTWLNKEYREAIKLPDK